MAVPFGLKKLGFDFIVSPRIGYARGTYHRLGFENETYKGELERKVFGLMNEARYPISLGDWKLEPSAEFNFLSSVQRGGERDKQYALNIKSQCVSSVESGVGLHLTHELDLDKDRTWKFSVGAMAYHEFADPYKLKVGFSGMDGSFDLRDENRSANHQVINASFAYDNKNYSLYGSLMSYFDKDADTALKSGFKWHFEP